jgi:hypothetical protein
MQLRKKIAIVFLAATLTPIYVAAQEKEFAVRVVSRGQKEIKVKTKGAGRGKSDGQYTEKDGQPKAVEINPR